VVPIIAKLWRRINLGVTQHYLANAGRADRFRDRLIRMFTLGEHSTDGTRHSALRERDAQQTYDRLRKTILAAA